MNVRDISPELKQRVARLRWDRIIEKHEGPEDWRWELDGNQVEFLQIDGYDVLLPVNQDQHPNITIIRCVPSADRRMLTIFLTDTTYYQEIFSGFMAVCEQVPGEDWYIALVYHEWFVIDDIATQFGSDDDDDH